VKTHDRYDTLRTCGVAKHALPICDKPLLAYPLKQAASVFKPTLIVIVTWASQAEEIKEAVISHLPDTPIKWVTSDETASPVEALCLALTLIPTDAQVTVLPGDLMGDLTPYSLPPGAAAAVTLYSDPEAPQTFVCGLNAAGEVSYFQTIEDLEFDGNANFPNCPISLRGDFQDAKIYHLRNSVSLAQKFADEESLISAISKLPVVSAIITRFEKKCRIRSLGDFLAWTQSVARNLKLKNGAFSASEIPEGVVVKNSSIGARVTLGAGARVARSAILAGAAVAAGVSVEDALVCPGAVVTVNVSGGVVFRTWKFLRFFFSAFNLDEEPFPSAHHGTESVPALLHSADERWLLPPSGAAPWAVLCLPPADLRPATCLCPAGLPSLGIHAPPAPVLRGDDPPYADA